MTKRKIATLIVTVVALVSMCIIGSLTAFASEQNSVPESKGTIDIWLIGGQSNAVGYGNDMPADAENDPRYYVGFDNTLYYGVHGPSPQGDGCRNKPRGAGCAPW